MEYFLFLLDVIVNVNIKDVYLAAYRQEKWFT